MHRGNIVKITINYYPKRNQSANINYEINYPLTAEHVSVTFTLIYGKEA